MHETTRQALVVRIEIWKDYSLLTYSLTLPILISARDSLLTDEKHVKHGAMSIDVSMEFARRRDRFTRWPQNYQRQIPAFLWRCMHALSLSPIIAECLIPDRMNPTIIRFYYCVSDSIGLIVFFALFVFRWMRQTRVYSDVRRSKNRWIEYETKSATWTNRIERASVIDVGSTCREKRRLNTARNEEITC